ncbi:MAG: SpoIIE family protein phosphatase [Bacteroidia bacterium]|nr:SpoIIE family protein phosphatase [Bacteroidia bacterium]
MTPHLLLVLSALCLSLAPLRAQELKLRRITVNEGLPVNTINALAQDSLGFIWMGTPSGLVRYDGYSLTLFKNNPTDSFSLCHDGIRSFACGTGGELWIGTRNGLSRFHPSSGHFNNLSADSTRPEKLRDGNVSSLLFVRGQLWIGTMGGGISILDTSTGNIKHLPFQSVPSRHIRAIIADKTGSIWVATVENGVVCLNTEGKILKHFTTANGLNSNETRNIFADSKGTIWISCWNAGLNVYEPSSGQILSGKDSSSWLRHIRYSLVSSFTEDRQGRIWLATAEHGAGIWNPQSQKMIYTESDPDDPRSLSDKTTLSLLRDRSGLIWIGTWHGGACLFDPLAHLIRHYRASGKKTGTLASNVVWRFAEGKNGKIFLGTSRSLHEFDPVSGYASVIKTFPDGTDDVPTTNTIVQAILETETGDLWLGTNGAGVYFWDEKKKKFTCYTSTDQGGKFPYHTCYWIHRDLSGGVWFCTTGEGLAKYLPSTDTFETYSFSETDSNSLSSNILYYLLERPDGKFWLATSEGLDLFDPKTGKSTRMKPGNKEVRTLLSKGVYTFTYSQNGRLWIGTAGGMCSYQESANTYTIHTADAEGPGDAEIMGLTEDEEERLWISTNKGLYIMNMRQPAYRLLEPADGIQSRQFLLNAIYRDKQGRIYLGGVNGFNMIDPRTIAFNSTPAPVIFTKLTVMNEEVPQSKTISVLPEIEIAYSDYFFSLEFAALEFSDPARNRYKYFLEGLSKEWVELGTTRFVTFTNLSPGRYVLKVKACNNHGIWNEQQASLIIIIPPPFYMTWWFYTLCVLSLLAGIWYYIRRREKKLQEEKAYLENVVSVRTRELREEKEKVDVAHKDIKDSINYAKRIQEATLPLAAELKKSLADSFILFMPRDVVSGDFYWFQEKGDDVFIVAADCTGHGVPGALMSMIGSSLLAQIVNEKNIHQPGRILSALNEDLRKALKQHLADSETRDGMDIALIHLNRRSLAVSYAGANRPLYIIRKNIPEIEEVRASKFPIGGSGNEEKHFEEHHLQLKPGDTLYIFSDGYPDQFGGGTGKKFMTKNFKRLLMLNHARPMEEIHRQLREEFEIWKGEFEQVDDVLVIGIRA